MNPVVKELREAAAGLRKQAEEAKVAHAVKCAQVLAAAKGLYQLRAIIEGNNHAES